MSRSWFFNKVPGQSIFRGQQVDLLHGYVSFDAYCCPFFTVFFIVVSYLGGALCHGPILADSLQKSETDSKGRSIFLEITLFMGQKN